MSKPEIVVLPDPAALSEEAGRRFVAAATRAISAAGEFHVALAGGSTPAGLYRLLAQSPHREQVDWSRTFVYFGDERCVPPDHPDSNYRMAREFLLDHVPVSPANVFRMAGELPPEEAAAIYERILWENFYPNRHRPRFDLILLGMGDDGHTASLFPGMTALNEKRRLVVATDVPAYVRPAVRRITFTLPLLNAAARVMFLVTGEKKAGAVRAVLFRQAQVEANALPAHRVRPTEGKLMWLLDTKAAEELRSTPTLASEQSRK
jgi:6-phosphogluconolactonase